MEPFDSDKSIEEIEFSKKSSSSSSQDLQKNPNNQNDPSQSEPFRFHNKFSESSDKSGIMSIEKAAYNRVESQRNLILAEEKFNKDRKSMEIMQNKASNLQDFLAGMRKNLENDRKISNQKEEIINLNSRLQEQYSEVQSLEEQSSKAQANIKIMTDEFNKCNNKILELEFSNKQLHEENQALKQKLNEISTQNQMNLIRNEELIMERKHFDEKIKNLTTQISILSEDNNAKNAELQNFSNFKRKVEILKQNLQEELTVLSEERFKIFLDQNDFIRLMKLLIKERTSFLQEIQDKNVSSEQYKKALQGLEIQTKENRLLIEERSSLTKINDNLMKKNFELEGKVFKLINEIEEKKARETMITSIIQDHAQIKIELDRKDKIVSEILLLLSFYEQIRLAYQGKINSDPSKETNIDDVRNLFAYSVYKEDLKTLQEKTLQNYPVFINRIQELFQEKKNTSDSFTQCLLRPHSAHQTTQITKEDGIVPYEEILRENEKIKKNMDELERGLEERLKIKVGKFKEFMEKLFGWRFSFSNGSKIIKLESVAKNFELFFAEENGELKLMNNEVVMGIAGNPPFETIPEILAYFTLN